LLPSRFISTGDAVLGGVGHQLLAREQVPFAPGRDDLDVRVQGVGAELEADLVVALAGGAVGDGIGAGLGGDLDQALGDQRPGDGGAEQIFALVDGVGAEHRVDEVAHELLAQVLDEDLLDAGGLGLGAGRLHLLALADVGGEGDHLAAVLASCSHAPPRITEVSRPAGIGQHHLVDIFDREAAFIERELAPIVERFPRLRVVLEHITTRDAVDFVRGAGPRVAATITAHHLLLNRNDMLVGGIRPHYYCLPILKRREHQEALRAAAVSGDPGFFLGTDSAPHELASKESACGCAGIYSAHAALEFYAEVFDELGALDRLEDFAARFGPAFYGLEPNRDTITLRRVAWQVPQTLQMGAGSVVPLGAGERLHWQVDPADAGPLHG
jgi:hypothetical protein